MERKAQKVSAECRRLDACITESEGMGADERMELLFKWASERYKTLEIRDEDIKTEEMQKVLAGRGKIEEFDEELYKGLIKQMVVYKDNSVQVIFQNNSSMKIGYGQT